MLRNVAVSLILFSALLPAQPQASISGTVTDSSSAVVPAAEVTLTETRTGIIQRTASNTSGVYTFPSLPSGAYTLAASRPGFQKFVLTGITLEVGARLSIDAKLDISATAEVVEVSAEATQILTERSTSVGGVVNAKQVLALPLVNRNVLALATLQAGTLGESFSGTRRGALNISLDGINVQDNRINSGVASTISITTDRIEEFRIVTSPADAEFGRGVGQIQVISRSGTNRFSGSLFEFHRNTAFNANNWFNNQRGSDASGAPISPRPVLLRHQFGGRVGGPIIKNKTFFHFNYEQLIQRTSTAITQTVLTEPARRGLFRYFSGIRNANADAAVPTVDLAGSPRPPTANAALQSVNLFTIDPQFRGRPDPSGRMAAFIGATPLPNNFRFGDGLNTAGYTWNRPAGDDFKQWVLKLDHNWTSRERSSVSYSREATDASNGFQPQRFPTALGGKYGDNASTLSVRHVSTLSSNSINEFTAGFQRPRVRFFSPWEVYGADKVLPFNGAQPFLPILASVTNPIEDQDAQGRISPVYSYADTFSRYSGKHALKAGAEVRWVSSNGFNSFTVIPRYALGSGVLNNAAIVAVPGIVANNGVATNILNDLTGTLANINQAFNAVDAKSPRFLSGEPRQRTWRQREISWFAKDDWKVTPSLTLNLGVRWEYYGVPYEALGRMAALTTGSAGIFGLSGTDFSSLYKPGVLTGSTSAYETVGPRSANPGKQIFAGDYNNFSPSVGLTYALPWFGKDKTVFRAGYGIGYERNSIRNLDVFTADIPGMRIVNNFRSSGLLSLANAPQVTPNGAPFAPVALTDRGLTAYSYDSGLRTPYIQNWNFSLQRALPARLSLDVRYVGSKGTRLLRASNINETNIFENGILDAFRLAQSGREAPLFDRIFNGLTLSGRTVGTNMTGAEYLRLQQTANLAAQSVGGVADFINRSTIAGLPGQLLRRANLPENFVVANPQFASALLLGNYANSTYHSLQVEVVRRAAKGLFLQANYTWSKNIGEEEGAGQDLLDSFRDGRNRRLEKRLLTLHRTHVIRSNAVYELPLYRGTNGFLKQALGGWQLSGIFNIFSGQPINTTSGRNSYNFFGGDNTASVDGPIAKSLGEVLVTGNGVQYFQNLNTNGTDPAIANMTPLNNVRSTSAMLAVRDTAGNVIFRNPVPGELGNLASMFLTGPGSVRLDMGLQKKFRFKETKEFIFQLDAENVPNSPQWGNPTTDINSVNFGRITSAGGVRILLLGARINF
jgi:hypothetical protein